MRTVLVVLGLLVVAGSAAAQDSTPDKVELLPKKPVKKRSDVVTFDEIQSIRSEVTNAYDVVFRLRRNYLQNRVQSQIGDNDGWTTGVRVVLNDVPYGDLESLRNIEASAIREIRYLNGPEASMRFGNSYHGGAILVNTR